VKLTVAAKVLFWFTMLNVAEAVQLLVDDWKLTV
jgi:hypothetical protein